MGAHVKVFLHAMFKESAGKREITKEVGEGATLRAVLDELAGEYGKDFKQILDRSTGQVNTDTLVMLNGQSVRKTDMQLKNGDVIMISVPIGGG